MPQIRKGLFHNPFRRDKKSGNTEAQKNHQDNGTTDSLLPTSCSKSSAQSTLPAQPAQSVETIKNLDLWKTAYEQMNDEEQRILSTARNPTSSDEEGIHTPTNAMISEIIQLTEDQYEKYQQKANRKLRASCQNIINAALSFKDIISAVAAFDPTQHAASAWAIVSLGLTVCNPRQQSTEN
jgi:hypothetical protein